MEIKNEKPVEAALAAWTKSAMFVAEVSVDCIGANAPKMTPIEKAAFYALMSYSVSDDRFKVYPQHKIGNFRVDFLVEWVGGDQIIIECDGHDFHERTKEQAQKDKRRDRELQSLGFKVYRFTGSEIWKTDGRCVLDSLNIQSPGYDYV